MVFPTWTFYGSGYVINGQDDLVDPWTTANIYYGENLGNGTWKYHVDIADHNNEGGLYSTHIYLFDNNDNSTSLASVYTVVKTNNYVASLYLDDDNATFNGNGNYNLSSERNYSNFTYEFDAMPTKTTDVAENGTRLSELNANLNFVIQEDFGRNSEAGIGLSLGTNGAVAIAHAGNYYYVLLSYAGDLSSQHAYRFTVKNNIPYLYVDGNLVATGIAPIEPVTTLFTDNNILVGNYGSYYGYANNFVLYNTAR